MSGRTVWKYTWPLPSDRASFDMPRDAEVLHVHEQNGTVCLWARVVVGRAIKRRDFILCGTGHPVPPLDFPYIGTAHLNDGQLVLHVFETAETANHGSPQT